MKRRESFEQMRKNRETRRWAELRRKNEQQRIEHERLVAEYAERDRRFKEQMARYDEFSVMSSALTQAACLPFMTPDYYADIKDQMRRLANEYGVGVKKKPQLRAV